MHSKTQCEEEKKVFYKNLRNLIFYMVVVGIIALAQLQIINKRSNNFEAFSNNQELLCSSTLVSKQKGYTFYEKDKVYFSNGENMFLIDNCDIKE